MLFDDKKCIIWLMYPALNPFRPGAGTPPRELVGREDTILDAKIEIEKVSGGRSGRPALFLGLRGVGKTVLLRTIRKQVEEADQVASAIEAPEGRSLAELLYPTIHKALSKLSRIESAKQKTYNAFRALKSFANISEIKIGDVAISFDPDPAQASTGDLESDLTDLFLAVGEAAKSAGKGWFLFIDEVQYLSQSELAAVIVALHAINQDDLPVQFFGAGLPQLAGLAGKAKSYAERLFDYPSVGPLSHSSVLEAIRVPIKEAGEEITDEAAEKIFRETEGYPYFVQEWGYQAWNFADKSPIDLDDINAASELALSRLDRGFFRVRYDQLSPAEQNYVHEMARIGPGPYAVADITSRLGGSANRYAPVRARVISKGVLFSPVRGQLAFTVPKYADFLQRTAMDENPIDNL